MEITQLKYFQVVARHEHMTRAAEELFITQPTLSKTIALLEKDIGFQLFDRNKNRILLNDAGKIFLSHVDRAFAELDIGIRRGQEAFASERTNLSISGNSPWFLDSVVAAVIETLPELRISSSMLSTPQVILNLISGRDELAILTERPHDSKLYWMPLVQESMVAISGQPIGEGEGSLRSLSQFAECRFFASKPNQEWRELTDRMCAQAGFVPNVVFDNLTQPDYMQLLKQTKAVVLSPIHMIMKNYHMYEPFNLYRLTDPFCQICFGLVYQQKPESGPRARFFDSVVELLTEQGRKAAAFQEQFH